MYITTFFQICKEDFYIFLIFNKKKILFLGNFTKNTVIMLQSKKRLPFYREPRVKFYV